jgi:hypothetical protein
MNYTNTFTSIFDAIGVDHPIARVLIPIVLPAILLGLLLGFAIRRHVKGVRDFMHGSSVAEKNADISVIPDDLKKSIQIESYALSYEFVLKLTLNISLTLFIFKFLNEKNILTISIVTVLVALALEGFTKLYSYYFPGQNHYLISRHFDLPKFKYFTFFLIANLFLSLTSIINAKNQNDTNDVQSFLISFLLIFFVFNSVAQKWLFDKYAE